MNGHGIPCLALCQLHVRLSLHAAEVQSTQIGLLTSLIYHMALTYVRESPLAQCRSPFGLSGLKASKNTWPSHAGSQHDSHNPRDRAGKASKACDFIMPWVVTVSHWTKTFPKVCKDKLCLSAQPRCDAQRLQTISRPPNSETVPTWQPPASCEVVIIWCLGHTCFVQTNSVRSVLTRTRLGEVAGLENRPPAVAAEL